MFDYERYGIKVGQKYAANDGSSGYITVIDVDTYKDCGDVIVRNYKSVEYRIDCFKLAIVRYSLDE